MVDVPSVPRRSSINAETLIVLAAALIASSAAVRFQAFERFCEFARHYESLQMDEVIVVALILCVAFCYLFISRELELRRYILTVEEQRAKALGAAYEDDLTGLPNRRAFVERLNLFRRSTDPDIAVIMLDLDGFKLVNDTHGHDYGDQVLRCVGARLEALAAKFGPMFAARLGGDEFACIVEGAVSEEALEELAQEILAEISAPLPHGCDATIGVSIGIASHANGAPLEQAIRKADAAMYRAKQVRGSFFVSALADSAVRGGRAIEDA